MVENKKKEYLTEEGYEKTKGKITKLALIILIAGLLIGGTIIGCGVIKKHKLDKPVIKEDIKKETNEEKLAKVEEKLEKEEEKLNTRKQELKDKGITYDAFTTYEDKEAYELKAITEALDPEQSSCMFSGKNNKVTKEYCKLRGNKESIETKMELDNRIDAFDNGIMDNADDIFSSATKTARVMPYYIIGGMIIFISCMISGILYIIAKGREIRSFGIQQNMPVTKEAIDKMAPTVGNAAGSVAEGITRGIKNGLKDNTDKTNKDEK